MNPRFLFLGTGTSAGIPAIACDCEVCSSDDPKDNRTRTGAAVRWTDPAGHERLVLIDATPDLRQQALRHGLRRCDAVLFTHNHVDHTFGLDEVRRFNVVMKKPIEALADAHTMEHLQRVYRHIFDRANNINESFVAHILPRLIDPRRPIDLWGMRFTPIPLLHGKLPVLGFRIEPAPDAAGLFSGDGAPPPPFPLAYCTDCSAIPPESWRLLEGLNTLVLDGLRFRKHPTHFTIPEAARVAEQVGARQTWLIHIAHDVMHARDDADLPQGVNLAWDGLELSAAFAGPPVPGRDPTEIDDGPDEIVRAPAGVRGDLPRPVGERSETDPAPPGEA